MDQKGYFKKADAPPYSASLVSDEYQYLLNKYEKLMDDYARLDEVSGLLLASLDKIADVQINSNFENSEIEEMLETAHILRDMLYHGDSVNERIGNYILGAKREAMRIMSASLEMAEIFQVPENTELTKINVRSAKVEKKEPKTVSKGLRQVKENYERDCQKLLILIDNHIFSSQ